MPCSRTGKPRHITINATQPASLIWPQKTDTGAWGEEEDGQEYIQQHFNIKNISKYFRTRSPVSAADINGWRAAS